MLRKSRLWLQPVQTFISCASSYFVSIRGGEAGSLDHEATVLEVKSSEVWFYLPGSVIFEHGI